MRTVILSLIPSFLALGQPYTISTFAGGALPTGQPALFASLGNVSAVAINATGDLFLVSSNYNAVFRVDAATQMVSLFAGNGTAGFSGDNGAAVKAQFAGPPSVAVDSAGTVYIADSANNRIRKVANGVISTVVGTGAAGFAGDGGPAAGAILNHPTGISLDAAGNLYFADSGNFRIRKVSGGVITTVAGSGTQGYDGEGGPATAAQLNAPSATAVDSAGNLYFVDSKNVINVGTFSRILRVANGVMTSVLTGPFGALTTFALAGNASGDLYIADSAFHGVLKLTTSGLIIGFAGNGTSGFSGDGGLPTNAQLSQASGIAVDAAGALYIADRDNYRIRKVSGDVIMTVAGNGTVSFAGDGGPAVSAQLNVPAGVAVDAAGNMYFADNHNYRVRKIAQAVITTVAGNGTFGSSGDNGPAMNAQLVPDAVAVDSTGNLFIADSLHHRVREVSNGVITTVAGNGTGGFSGDGGPAAAAQLNTPSGVAVDSAGNLYIADTLNYRIRKVSNGIITTIAGGGSSLGDNGPATSAQLNEPSDVAVDAAGNLYIADNYNGRIREVSGGNITTVAGNGSTFFPLKIAVDGAGSVYFTENSRLSKVSNGAVTTIAGTATPGFTPDGALAAGAQLGHPTGIAVDVAGNVYFADSLYNRIRVLTPGPGPPLLISASSIVNAASFTPGMPLVPGSIATVFGTFPETSLTLAGGVPLPNSLAGLSIVFEHGMQAPLLAVTSGQVNFQVPWELGGTSQVSLAATVDAQTTAAQSMSLAPFAPGLFVVQGGGMQVGAVLDNASGILIDSRHPAIPGSTILQIYGTGFGAVTNQPATGAPALGAPLSQTTTVPTVSIGYPPVSAQVLYSGLAPGLVGVYQVDALVPAAVQCSSFCFLPLTVSIGGAVSNSVSVAVQ